MSKSNNHFGEKILSASERAQGILTTSRVGKQVISAFTGSSSPAYRQLTYQSRDLNARARTDSFVDVAGDSSANRLIARRWTNCAVLQTDIYKLATITDHLLDQVGDRAAIEHAVAYATGDTLHVGICPEQPEFFGAIPTQGVDRTDAGVAMRLGRGPLRAVMGLWLPEQREFIGLDTNVVEPNYSIAQLSAPGSPYSTLIVG